MKYLLDSHTHTIASGHAYNTILEMAAAAAEKGLELLAITEHAVAMPGTTGLFYFMNLKTLPRKMNGITVLFGTELNIMDYTGKVDLEENVLRQMDVCIASLHTPCIRPGTAMQNTQALLGAMENPYVNIIGHPDDGRYPIDYDTLAAAAREHHVLLELNSHSLEPGSFREGAWENDRQMLEACKKYQTSIILNSDAHWCGQIGEFEISRKLLEEVSFPEQLIVNTDVDRYCKFINRFRFTS